jgi:hypothetical protein
MWGRQKDNVRGGRDVATAIFVRCGLRKVGPWNGGHSVHEWVTFGYWLVDGPHAAQLMLVNPDSKYIKPDPEGDM